MHWSADGNLGAGLPGSKRGTYLGLSAMRRLRAEVCDEATGLRLDRRRTGCADRSAELRAAHRRGGGTTACAVAEGLA